MQARNKWLMAMVVGLAAGGCGPATEEPADPTGEELELGDVDDEGVKADGWGAALNCKPIPDLPALKRPSIVVSLDGLTLHLRDLEGDYDKVFPIGPGKIDSTGKSLTPVGNFKTGSDTREVPDNVWGYYYPCRIWHKEADPSKNAPVFAGLPFIRLVGPPTAGYGLHGPVDAYARADGGLLRRGYVSAGCVRMRPQDIVEVYARIKGKPGTPVRIQKDIERDVLGRAVDVPEKWIGQECLNDADCNFAGGVCKKNPYGRGWCTKACSGSCPDLQGYNTTRCVRDGTAGTCAITADRTNNFCKGQYGRTQKTAQLHGRTGSASVCLPGTRGALGDPCLASGECGTGAMCQPAVAQGPGFCSQACTSTCPGADTMCTRLGGDLRCVERCRSQDQCSYGLACEDGVPRAAGGTASACIPG